MAKKTTGKKVSTSKKSRAKKARKPQSTRSAKTKSKQKKAVGGKSGVAKKAKKVKTAKTQSRAAKPVAKQTKKAKSSRSAVAATATKKTRNNGRVADGHAAKGNGKIRTNKKTNAGATASASKKKIMGRSSKPKSNAPISKNGSKSKQPSTGRGKKTRTVAEAASTVAADSKGYVFINGRRVRMISTKNQVPLKKSRANGTATSTPAEVVETVPVGSIKTALSRKQLNHYRELLLLKRRELVGDLSAMENEALRSGGGNISHMPIHMADIGTDTYDQDFMLGLAATERDQLREIDAALQRIEDRTYGVCQLSGEQIPTARLDVKPWAKYTVESARKMEGQWIR